MNIKLRTEQHLEFLSLKVGCTGLSESTHVKMPHRLNSHVTAHMFILSSSQVKKDIVTLELIKAEESSWAVTLSRSGLEQEP